MFINTESMAAYYFVMMRFALYFIFLFGLQSCVAIQGVDPNRTPLQLSSGDLVRITLISGRTEDLVVSKVTREQIEGTTTVVPMDEVLMIERYVRGTPSTSDALKSAGRVLEVILGAGPGMIH